MTNTPPSAPALSVGQGAQIAHAVLDRVGEAVVGNREPLMLVLAGGHVLLEDFPGLGKTLAARSFAQALGLEFRRVQFTPDLLPSDVTGSYVFDRRIAEFAFRPGPIFTGLLLADEINRTPPKTSPPCWRRCRRGRSPSRGRPICWRGRSTCLPPPTRSSTRASTRCRRRSSTASRCGSASAIRTWMREWDILARRIGRRQEDQQVAAVTDAAGLAAVQACVESVQVEQSVVVTRDPSHCHPPALQDHGRGLTAWALALMTIARAVAVIEGRDYVIPEDVKRVAAPVLAHRIGIKPELWLHDVSAVGIIEEILAVVPVPAEARAGVRA